MWLEVLDNVLCLGVGDDKLEANEVFVLTPISRTDGGEKVVTLGFISLSVFIDFGLVLILQGVQLIHAGARVRVRHAEIENKRAVRRRQSDKDISLLMAVSMLGHDCLRSSALDVRGACG